MPCTTPTLTIPAGNRIPGIAATRSTPRSPGRRRRAGAAGSRRRALSKVWVNDANTDAAAGYATFAGYVGYLARIGAFELSGFGRIDNLFDRGYVGSVIVGEGNARFFEPAPGRTWSLGGSVARSVLSAGSAAADNRGNAGLSRLPPSRTSRPPRALTIGNFDGVHRGHQAMLALLVSEAAHRGLPPTAC